MATIQRAVLIGKVPVVIRLTFYHWVPRLFGAGAITPGLRIWFKRGIVGPIQLAPILVAHELVHVEQRVRRGFWGYWWMIVREIGTAHDQRSYEREAITRAEAVLAGIDPTICATAWLSAARVA